MEIAEIIKIKRRHLLQEQAMLTHFCNDTSVAAYRAGRISEIRDVIKLLEEDTEDGSN